MSDRLIGRRIGSRDNFLWLLLALLVLFFCSAFFEQIGSDALGRVTGIFLTVIVVVAVWTIEQSFRSVYARLVISAVLVAIVGMELVFDHYGLAVLQLVMLLVFIIATIVLSCRQVLLSGHVDLNKILGAICIYMFLALAWALGYLLVEEFFPGSVPGITGDDWREAVQKSVYYSFVTLSTLGFGDITAVQPLARYLTYIEAVIGQFYLAAVVASLIGVRLAAEGAGQRG